MLDQIWSEQHEGVALGCRTNDAIKEYNEATGRPTVEMDEETEICNHDMLYMLGACDRPNRSLKYIIPL